MTVFKHNYNVFIPTDYEFNYKELKKLYKRNQKLLDDERSFKELTKNTFIYSFFKEKKFICCIYYYEEQGKMYVNAFSTRHHHEDNMLCFKESLNWFNCDIFARSRQKTSILCLLKANFKKIEHNLYKYERK